MPQSVYNKQQKRQSTCDPSCGECGEAGKMECLLCLKAGTRPSPVFCSMECYRQHWKTHRASPSALLPKTSAFPGKIFQGSQPFSSNMLPVQNVRQRHSSAMAPNHTHHTHAVMSPMMYQHPMRMHWPMMHSVPDPVRKS